jgi:hypothetical protein
VIQGHDTAAAQLGNGLTEIKTADLAENPEIPETARR